ncbi:hypothetical protein [Caniella muris]|uniref:hypothetical protein n=1 Tax=Caniella muris TaxID=2941502 RepID=UPI00203BA0AF|nr:hypothetical protein [Caniella muris]
MSSPRRPLNYALLKYFTTVESADVDAVMAALGDEYGELAAFRRDRLIESLMTAEKNGLIQEAGARLDANGDVCVSYRADEGQRKTINFYIN